MLVLRGLILIVLSITSAYADIQTTADLRYIQKEIYKSDKDTLVIFDVDQVLITPDDVILKDRGHEANKFCDATVKQIKKDRNSHEYAQLMSVINISAKLRPVTPETLTIFNEIKDSGYKVIALTATGVGAYGNIDSLEDWRINDLKNQGFIFSKLSSNTTARQLEPYLLLTAKERAKQQFSPMYKDGILFSCNIPKGKVLEAYFKHAKLKPKKIIFIDDKRKNIVSVAKYCHEAKIKFVGIEYTAVKHAANEKFNLERAKLQFATLTKSKVWLSDLQADKILSESNS